MITFLFVDSCSGQWADLVSATLTGSPSYSLLSPWDVPRTTHAGDSIAIHYAPQTSGQDNAQLILKFRLGTSEYDTTITLTGAGRIPKKNLTLRSVFASPSVSQGQTTDLVITPDKAISGRGLSKISFDLVYDGDLLGKLVERTDIIGASILTVPLPRLFGKESGLHVTISGNDLMLDPAQAIARLTFETFLTDVTATNVSITNLQLNDGDQNFANCILSADTSATTFTLALQCGDSVLSRFLQTKGLFIESIRPNPASEAVTVSLHAEREEAAQIELVNAIGVVVSSQLRTFSPGANEVELATTSLSNGVYYLRVRSGGRVVGGSVVIAR